MSERGMRIDRDELARLAAALAGRRVLALTGAGLSVDAGIPDYRDADGTWKRHAPVQFRDFLERADVRRRYWARSMAGWEAFAAARPGPGHEALAALERAGRLIGIVSQNVDELHRRAGSRLTLALHGRLARVRCLACGRRSARAALQRVLLRENPDFAAPRFAPAPDGDAELEVADFTEFRVPACPRCGGLLKPDVTFYGETIAPERTRRADAAVAAADALLVVGTSLMVFSAYRLVRAAARRGIPVVAINLGRTRAESLLARKLVARADAALPALAAALA